MQKCLASLCILSMPLGALSHHYRNHLNFPRSELTKVSFLLVLARLLLADEKIQVALTSVGPPPADRSYIFLFFNIKKDIASSTNNSTSQH
jgi:hypothetical protein